MRFFLARGLVLRIHISWIIYKKCAVDMELLYVCQLSIIPRC